MHSQPLGHVPLHLRDQVVQVLRVGGDEAGHEVPLLTAQQLIDGHPKTPGHQVVQRDVDGRHGRGQHPPALEVLAAVRLLPDPPNPPRVLPDQEVPKVRHRPAHRQVARAQPGLTPAVIPVVRLDPHHLQVPPARVKRVKLDVSDLHNSAWHGGRTTDLIVPADVTLPGCRSPRGESLSASSRAVTGPVETLA